MLVPFVKAPAINDQTLPDRWQDFFVDVRQVVTPPNRGDLLLAGSFANKHWHVVPERPPPGYGAKQFTCGSRANSELCLITLVVTRNRKTAVRIEN